MAFMHDLPFEILYEIIRLLSPHQLAIARLVSKQMRSVCDKPALWRTIYLRPPNNQKAQWSLHELKSILTPHTGIIQNVNIWDVRDDIVQYLLLDCSRLQELTIHGWTTLSEHAFLLPQHVNIHRLRLIGETKTNFTSLDSITFSKFIQHCPHLEELSIVSCHIHLHADSLLETLYHHHPLKYLNLATKQTWSIEHVVKLFQICSNLSILALVPDIIQGPHTDEWSILQKNYQFLQEQEMAEFSNIILFR